jgi:hypothetical protein
MVGEMDPMEAARQMALAWHYFHHPPHAPSLQKTTKFEGDNHLINWTTASHRYQTILNIPQWWDKQNDTATATATTHNNNNTHDCANDEKDCFRRTS